MSWVARDPSSTLFPIHHPCTSLHFISHRCSALRRPRRHSNSGSSEMSGLAIHVRAPPSDRVPGSTEYSNSESGPDSIQPCNILVNCSGLFASDARNSILRTFRSPISANRHWFHVELHNLRSSVPRKQKAVGFNWLPRLGCGRAHLIPVHRSGRGWAVPGQPQRPCGDGANPFRVEPATRRERPGWPFHPNRSRAFYYDERSRPPSPRPFA